MSDHFGSGSRNGSGPGSGSGPTTARGYYPWRPQARTRALLELVHAVMREDAEYLPETIRQVYYALIGRQGYGKSKSHERALYRAVDNARRARPLIGAPHLAIPFDAIRDDGITVGIDHSYLGIEDFHEETARRAKAFRLSRQEGQRDRLEVWCEAAGMLPQLHRVAREYGVPVYSNGGANSSTGNWQVSRRALRFSGRTILLHVGDFDPHGEAIFDAVAGDIAAFVEADRTLAIQCVEAVRVALTVKQVEAYGLPTDRLKKPKKGDRATPVLNARWRERYGDRTCQVEALPAKVLAEVVRAEIETRMDLDIWQRVVEEEQGIRAALLGLPPGADEPDEPELPL